MSVGAHCWLVVGCCALAACDRGPLDLRSKFHVDTLSVTRAVGWKDMGATGRITVHAKVPAVAEAMERALTAKKLGDGGALTVEVTLDPADPTDSKTLKVNMVADAGWVALPKYVSTHLTYDGTLTRTGRTGDVRRAVAERLAGELVEQLEKERPAGAAAPVEAPPATAIAVGQDFTCTLHEDKSVHCWLSGEVPNRVPIEGAVELAADGMTRRMCARLSTGRVTCWAARGDTEHPPANVCGVDHATAIALGIHMGCALDGVGQVKCWPDAPDALEPACKASAIPVDDVRDATALSVGDHTGCALVSGRALCWSDCKPGACKAKPVGLDGLASLMIGGDEACGLDAAGKLRCAAGEPRFYDRAQLVPGSRLFAQGMGMYGCAIDPVGGPSCFGIGPLLPDGGGLGDGTNASRAQPVAVKGLDRVRSISPGTKEVCAVDDAGRVWCWGLHEIADDPNPNHDALTPEQVTIY